MEKIGEWRDGRVEGWEGGGDMDTGQEMKGGGVGGWRGGRGGRGGGWRGYGPGQEMRGGKAELVEMGG